MNGPTCQSDARDSEPHVSVAWARAGFVYCFDHEASRDWFGAERAYGEVNLFLVTILREKDVMGFN